MTILVYVILPIVGSLFLIFLLLWGMRQMSDRKGQNIRSYFGVTIGFSIIVVALCIFGSLIGNAVLLIGTPIVGYFLNRGTKITLVYNYSLVVAAYLADVAAELILRFMMAGGFLYLNQPELIVLCYQLVARLSEFLAIRFFVLIVRKCQSGMISGKQLAVSLVLPAFSILNVVTLLIFMQVYTTPEMYVLFLVNVVLLLVLNIWFAVLLDTLSENNRLENELSLAGQQAKLQMEYYQREEEKYEESRKLLHDMRNHVQTMEQLYREQNLKEGLSYVQNLHGMLNHLGQTYYTSDKLLNIILNDKAALMEQKKIQADIRIGEIDLSFMQNTDITTVFGNILDNAIEAAEKSRKDFTEEKGERNDRGFVRLRVKTVNCFLSIAMENSAVQGTGAEDVDPADSRMRAYRDFYGKKQKRGGIKSEKRVTEHLQMQHQGIGLKNVKRVVEHYDGDMQCEWKDGVFYTKIMLSISTPNLL